MIITLAELAPIVLHNDGRPQHVLHLHYQVPGLHVARAIFSNMFIGKLGSTYLKKKIGINC